MTEKYDVVDLSRRAGGGEYPNQDGFGWTNGVALALVAQASGIMRMPLPPPIMVPQPAPKPPRARLAPTR
jgi:alpha,alpha-trehalase